MDYKFICEKCGYEVTIFAPELSIDNKLKLHGCFANLKNSKKSKTKNKLSVKDSILLIIKEQGPIKDKVIISNLLQSFPDKTEKSIYNYIMYLVSKTKKDEYSFLIKKTKQGFIYKEK